MLFVYTYKYLKMSTSSTSNIFTEMNNLAKIKPSLSTNDLPENVKLLIVSVKRVKTKFGKSVILMELEDSVVFCLKTSTY